MEIKRHYILLLLVLFISITLFSTCKPNCDPNNPPAGVTGNLVPRDKSILFPYKDFDTIRFIRNNTDTVLFLGGKFETGYTSGLDNNFDCPHLNKYQFMNLTFTNSLIENIIIHESSIYSITFKDRIFKTDNVLNVSANYDTSHIFIRGISYKSVYKFNANSTTDNLYFAPSRGIIKIIYKNDTYEKLP